MMIFRPAFSKGRFLVTQRLQLEPIRVSHADEAWPALDDARMWTYFPALRPPTLDDLRRLYARWERGPSDPREIWLNLACRDRTSSALVGSVQATVYADSSANIAYAVYPAYQRMGYAREALTALLGRLRIDYQVKRIRAEIDTRNEPSYRLVESLGLVRRERRAASDLGQGENAEQYAYSVDY